MRFVMRKIIIPLLIILLSGSFVLSVTYPGIPCQFLFRSLTPSSADSEWDHLEEQFSGADGMVYALRGAGEYFSGENSRVYYLGLENSFEFTFSTGNMNSVKKEYKLLFFLNYKRISPEVQRAGWQRIDTVEETLEAGGWRTYRFRVDNLPEGSNELCVLFSSPEDVKPSGRLGEESLFSPRHMQIAQLIRGYNESPFMEVEPIETALFEAHKDEIVFRIKDSRMTVVNPFGKELTGVLFFSEFDRKPIFYRIPAGSVNIYQTASVPDAVSVFNVTDPYAPMEDFWGTPLFPHSFMSGN